MSQEALRTLLKTKIRETAFKELIAEKEKNSKLKALKYTYLSLQPYLTAESTLTNEEKRSLFRWRSHMIKVKQNFGLKDAKCPLCKDADDTQYHLLTCPLLSRPGHWNIKSVVSALRAREVILELERKQKSDKNQTVVGKNTKNTKNKNTNHKHIQKQT